MIATERLYRTEDDRIVPEGDPAARWLFAGAGAEIPAADAARYGLIDIAAAPFTAVEEESPAEAEAASAEGPAAEASAEEPPVETAEPEAEAAVEEPAKPKRRKKSSN
jgi:hypothetical protein